MDKMKSAVYNASYTAGNQMLKHMSLREDMCIKIMDREKSVCHISLFELQDSAAKFRLCQKKKERAGQKIL